MVGHGHQALFDMHQSPVQRAFLPGAPRLLQKLLGLQFRLQLLFFLRPPGSGGVELSVDVLAQRQQFGMVGRELQSLLDQGATVLQRVGLQTLAGLGEQPVGFGSPLGGGVNGGRWGGWSDDDGGNRAALVPARTSRNNHHSPAPGPTAPPVPRLANQTGVLAGPAERGEP